MQYAAVLLAVLGVNLLLAGAMIGFIAEGEKPFSQELVVCGLFGIGLAVICSVIHVL